MASSLSQEAGQPARDAGVGGGGTTGLICGPQTRAMSSALCLWAPRVPTSTTRGARKGGALGSEKQSCLFCFVSARGLRWVYTFTGLRKSKSYFMTRKNDMEFRFPSLYLVLLGQATVIPSSVACGCFCATETARPAEREMLTVRPVGHPSRGARETRRKAPGGH